MPAPHTAHTAHTAHTPAVCRGCCATCCQRLGRYAKTRLNGKKSHGPLRRQPGTARPRGMTCAFGGCQGKELEGKGRRMHRPEHGQERQRAAQGRLVPHLETTPNNTARAQRDGERTCFRCSCSSRELDQQGDVQDGANPSTSADHGGAAAPRAHRGRVREGWCRCAHRLPGCGWEAMAAAWIADRDQASCRGLSAARVALPLHLRAVARAQRRRKGGRECRGQTTKQRRA